ncbi:hypothetical protein AAL_00243 [Moelleriella libera RCEF 2490]|uniref:Uncharacterized protein n=1 Tax=Moelleriella libera RCEF 2490 TaxID=1081109 RepID=A0A166UP57_9HYPO|nr:hypothetical protein AAL_00243 [Moelleriella libera RCEF 2490]
MPTTKPKLEKLSTPLTATFPSEITSASSNTPASALSFSGKTDLDFLGTPVSPPSAYADFLSKALAMNSPPITHVESSPDTTQSTPESEDASNSSKNSQSSPTSSISSTSSPPLKARSIRSGSFSAAAPLSAPPTGATVSFPSLRLPASPAISNIDSPLSASTVRSPFSARSVHSAFDWDAALKARFSEKKQKPSSTSVRHVREVVTRTVTYTPRMDPAPRGKRRKVD